MPDYSNLTESPGGRLSHEGAMMLFGRYAYGAQVATNKRVLEVGCGPGLGLGLLSRRAAAVAAGDIDPGLVRRARATYGRRIPLIRLDAQSLPFGNYSFDVVLFYEGSYYVPRFEKALDEICRVLSRTGTAVFVNANPERQDFIPSPLSTHYHTADEFRRLFELRGFTVAVEVAFPLDLESKRGRFGAWARRVASGLGLIPRTLAGRVLLRRLLTRRLLAIPPEVPDGFTEPVARFPVSSQTPAANYKVIYITATRDERVYDDDA